MPASEPASSARKSFRGKSILRTADAVPLDPGSNPGRRGLVSLASEADASYIRDQVCDLQKTLSMQPFIVSELPLTAPDPL